MCFPGGVKENSWFLGEYSENFAGIHLDRVNDNLYFAPAMDCSRVFSAPTTLGVLREDAGDTVRGRCRKEMAAIDNGYVFQNRIPWLIAGERRYPAGSVHG